jgi:transcriptional regulator with XRE-family HTH domain
LAAFASRLIEARTRKMWRQEDLAAASGVSQSYISQLEKGKWEPKMTTVLLLARALGASLDDLLPPDDIGIQ